MGAFHLPLGFGVVWGMLFDRSRRALRPLPPPDALATAARSATPHRAPPSR